MNEHIENVRRASEVLLKVSKDATPGPWLVDGQGPGPESRNMGCGVVYTMGETVMGGDIAGPAGDMYPRGDYSPDHDMTLISIMDPDMAEAVALWLRSTANAEQRKIEMVDERVKQFRESGEGEERIALYERMRDREGVSFLRAMEVASLVLRKSENV